MRHTCLGCLVGDHLEGSLAHFDIDVLLHLFILDLIFFITHEIDLEIFIIVLNFTLVLLLIDLTVIVAILIFRDSV